MAEVLVPARELPDGWREQLAAIARRTRAVYTRHPRALIALQGARPGPNAMRHFEQCLGALSKTGLDAAAKLELLGVIDDFVFGHALRSGETRAQAGAERELGAALVTFTKRQLATGEYPETAALFGDTDKRKVPERVAWFGGDEQRFERGLRALLDDAERGLRSQRRPKPKPARKARS